LKFLVTGGGGFIGSNIVEYLLLKGHFVRTIDNFITGKKENLSEFKDDIEIIEGDIRDYRTVQKAVNGMEIILHQAAVRSADKLIETTETNITGTVNLLEAAKNNNIRRFIFASSSAVYENTLEIEKYEGMVLNPFSPYALSKITGEKFCQIYYNSFGLETISLRYFNVFGPRQEFDSQFVVVIPKFINAILEGKQPVIYGDGEQSRDFTYITNVVMANYLAATSEIKKFGFAANCGCHDRLTLNQLVDSINEILHSEIFPIYSEPDRKDPQHSFANINLAEKMFGYKPSVNFREGLEKTVGYFKQKLFRM